MAPTSSEAAPPAASFVNELEDPMKLPLSSKLLTLVFVELSLNWVETVTELALTWPLISALALPVFSTRTVPVSTSAVAPIVSVESPPFRVVEESDVV